MVRRGHPEIARSIVTPVTAAGVRPGGIADVSVMIQGANGQTIEALYEPVWPGAWRINGVATRPDAGVM